MNENELHTKVWSELPIDIVNQILDFRYKGDHSLMFDNTLQNIPFSSANRKIHMLINKHQESNGTIDFLNIILANTDYDERCFIVREIEKCDCCKRHNKNKPTVDIFRSYLFQDNQPTWVDSNRNYDELLSYCNCNCRHMSRWICRAELENLNE